MEAAGRALLPQHEIIKHLQRLTSANVDSAECFRHAAARVEGATLHHLFLNEAAARESASEQLQQAIVEMGGEPHESGTRTAGLHRWWMSLRAGISDNEGYPLLAEVERAERALQKQYDEVLREPLGAPVLEVLARHRAALERSCETIAAMRKSAAA